MSLKSVFFAAAIAVGLGVVAVSSSAHAGGFLGDIINQVAPGVGTQLDQLNHNLGNPVDHAGAAALDAWAPGAGRALELGWQVQRRGILNQGGFQGGGIAMGNFCATQAGVFGPGPINPVGQQCFANTSFGQVIQR